MPFYNPHHGDRNLMAATHPSNYALVRSILENQLVEIADVKCMMRIGGEDGKVVDVQAANLYQKFEGRRSRACFSDYSLNSSETEYIRDDRSIVSNNTVGTTQTTPDNEEAKLQVSEPGHISDASSEPDLVEDVPALPEAKRILHWAMGSTLEDRVIQDSRGKNHEARSANPKTDGTVDENKESDTPVGYFIAKSVYGTDGDKQRRRAPSVTPANSEQSEVEESPKDMGISSGNGRDPSPPPNDGSPPTAGDGSAAGGQAVQTGDGNTGRAGWRQRRKGDLRRYKQALKDCSCFTSGPQSLDIQLEERCTPPSIESTRLQSQKQP